MLSVAVTAQAKCLQLQNFYFVPKEPHPFLFQFHSCPVSQAASYINSELRLQPR
jgi:hypothetical protein